MMAKRMKVAGYGVLGRTRSLKRELQDLHRYICMVSFMSFRVPYFITCRLALHFGHLGGIGLSKSSKDVVKAFAAALDVGNAFFMIFYEMG